MLFHSDQRVDMAEDHGMRNHRAVYEGLVAVPLVFGPVLFQDKCGKKWCLGWTSDIVPPTRELNSLEK